MVETGNTNVAAEDIQEKTKVAAKEIQIRNTGNTKVAVKETQIR